MVKGSLPTCNPLYMALALRETCTGARSGSWCSLSLALRRQQLVGTNNSTSLGRLLPEAPYMGLLHTLCYTHKRAKSNYTAMHGVGPITYAAAPAGEGSAA